MKKNVYLRASILILIGLFVSCATPKLERKEKSFKLMESEFEKAEKLIEGGSYFSAYNVIYQATIYRGEDYGLTDFERALMTVYPGEPISKSHHYEWDLLDDRSSFDIFFNNVHGSYKDFRGDEKTFDYTDEAFIMLEPLRNRRDELLRTVENLLPRDKQLNDYLKRDFPRFYAFLDGKGLKDAFWYNLLMLVPHGYSANFLPDTYSYRLPDNKSSITVFLNRFNNYESFQKHASQYLKSNNMRSLFSNILSDFEFHDLMELLEKDCYDNLSRSSAADFFATDSKVDKITPNYETRTYDFRYDISIDASNACDIYANLKKNAIESAGVKFRYSLPNASDCDFVFRLEDSSSGWKSDNVTVGRYDDPTFRGVPDNNARKYSVKLVDVRSKRSSSSVKSTSGSGSVSSSSKSSSGSNSSSSGGLKSIFGSVMCEVCGDRLALYEAFDPVKNKRVNFCRQCLEKRQQEDNAKLQKALEQLQVL